MQAPRSLSNRTRRSALALQAGIAAGDSQILAAQRLRFDVFSAEYGANLGSGQEGVDADRFDPHCQHIIVSDPETGQVIATTRVLLGQVAAGIGGFYSEDEFELGRLKSHPGVFAELGRTCIHPDYRQSAALSILWSATSQLLLAEQVDYLIGCASISMLDGGRKAWLITQQLHSEHLAPEAFRVTPRRALPHLAGHSSGNSSPNSASLPSIEIPPLIRAYLRLGAQVCGAPCWDPGFRCADLLVLLDVERLAARYARRYMSPPLHKPAGAEIVPR